MNKSASRHPTSGPPPNRSSSSGAQLGRPPLSPDDVQAFRAKVAAQALAVYRSEGFDQVSMRRLAREVGCSATTLYAHFAGKTEILMQLWADVLGELADRIQTALAGVVEPRARLREAALTFIAYWIEQPEHFRLVFMSNDVTRADVDGFLEAGATQAHFRLFHELVGAVIDDPDQVSRRGDALIAGLIGIALCCNTIRNYPWPQPAAMTEQLLETVYADAKDGHSTDAV